MVRLLNVIRLNTVKLNIVGGFLKKIIRYIPDNEVPDTHIQFYGVDNEPLIGSDDNKFYGKI